MASLADRLSPRPAPTPLHDPDLCACLQPAWDGAGGGAAAAAAAAGGGGGGGGVPMRRRVRGRGPVRAAPRRGAARRPQPHRRRQGAGPLRPRLAPLPRARAARQLRLRPRQLRHPRRPDALRRRRRTGLRAAPGPGHGRARARRRARAHGARPARRHRQAHPRARPDPLPRRGGRLPALRPTTARFPARARRGRLPPLALRGAPLLQGAAAPPHRAAHGRARH